MIIDKIQNSMKGFSAGKKTLRVLLCVSGGPDSVAMFYLFNSLARSMRMKLFIAHLNHKLRSGDSDKDEIYVKGLANKLRIPIITAQEDVQGFAETEKLSLEDAARRIRYRFFFEVAKDLNIDIIATAHTKDDQAETMLMRLLRGAGLRGLRGISPARKIRILNNNRPVFLIRPLIDVSRREIEEYLRSRKIKARLDASNLESKFFRNKIRLKLLPLLEREYSKNIKNLLSNLSDMLDKDYEFVSKQQECIFKRDAGLGRANTVTFGLSYFKRQHPSLQRGLIRLAIEYLAGSLDGIDYNHCKEIESLVNQRPIGSIVHMPGSIEVIKTKAAIKFFRGRMQKKEKNLLGPIRLNIPGSTKFGRKSIRAEIIHERPHLLTSHPKSMEYFDMQKISLPLMLRFRQPGDKMMPLGMNGFKKISDIFTDDKIPQYRRNNIPLVVSANGDVIWACGVRISEKCKVTSKTKSVLKLILAGS